MHTPEIGIAPRRLPKTRPTLTTPLPPALRRRRASRAAVAAWVALSIPLAAVERSALGQATETAAASGRPAQPRMTIRGKKYKVYPVHQLRDKGIPVRDVDPSQDAAERYVEAMNARIECPEDLAEAYRAAQSGDWPEGETGERLARWLDQNAPALDAVTRGAAMPDCRTLCFGEPDVPVIGILLPHMSEQRELTRMLAARATLSQARGDTQSALADAYTMQRAASHTAGGFTLIEHLVGVACADLASQTFENVIAAGDLPPDQIRDTLADWEQMTAAFPTIETALHGERAMSRDIMDHLRTDPKALQQYFTPEEAMQATGATVFEGWDKLFMRVQNILIPEQTMTSHLDAFYGRALELVNAATQDGRTAMNFDESYLDEAIPEWNTLGRFFLPSIGRTLRISVSQQSNRQRAVMRAAVAAYTSAHGKPPESIEALVPEFLPEIPMDPATGEPFSLAADEIGGVTGGIEPISPDGKPRPPRGSATPNAAAAAGGGTAASADGEPPTDGSPDAWRQYVKDFIKQHKLAPAQRRSAWSIYDGLKRRRDQDAKVRAKREPELIARMRSATLADEVTRLGAELARLQGREPRMFEELRKRLDSLLTAEQRAKQLKQAASESQPHR